MTGSRRSGVRVVIPPQCAEQPVRLTIRQLRPDQVLFLPPLSEGEALASRIIQVTPASFLSPVLLEVPHFASLSSNREIVVLRSDNGKKWSQHFNTTDIDNQQLTAFLSSSISNLNNNDSMEVTTITTPCLPQYFAVVSRPRQELHVMGPEGGDIVSHQSTNVQCHFPSRSLTKEINVGLSVFEIDSVYMQDLLQQGGAMSSVVTVEPRRRKFHKPITVTMPLPETRNIKKSTASIETSLMLMCSMSGSGTRCVWEDVTMSTPLVIAHNTAQFTTVVSAQFWLLRLPTWMAVDKLSIADNTFKLASRSPYLAHMWIFSRLVDNDEDVEMEVRLILATEGERVTDSNLEDKENFTQIFYSSDKTEFLDRGELMVRITGNLEAAVELTPVKMTFRPFAENRLTVPIRRKEPEATPVGRLELVNDCDIRIHSMPLSFKKKKTIL